jgi:hypothetical protein
MSRCFYFFFSVFCGRTEEQNPRGATQCSKEWAWDIHLKKNCEQNRRKSWRSSQFKGTERSRKKIARGKRGYKGCERYKGEKKEKVKRRKGKGKKGEKKRRKCKHTDIGL